MDIAEKAQAVKAEAIRYRVVSNEEMEILAPLFAKLGWPMPEQEFAKVVVAEAGEGKDAVIIGFQVVEFIVHAGWLWVHPALRGEGVAEEISRQTVHYIENDCKIKRYICTAKPGSFGSRIAVANGFKLVPQEMYVKQVP